jgi:hypothetical protein
MLDHVSISHQSKSLPFLQLDHLKEQPKQCPAGVPARLRSVRTADNSRRLDPVRSILHASLHLPGVHACQPRQRPRA